MTLFNSYIEKDVDTETTRVKQLLEKRSEVNKTWSITPSPQAFYNTTNILEVGGVYTIHAVQINQLIVITLIVTQFVYTSGSISRFPP